MPNPFALNRKQLILMLSLIAGGLSLISVPMTLLEYWLLEVSWSLSDLARCFTLDSENSIPSWYSSGLLFLCGLALACVALYSRAGGDCWWKHWCGLAVLFGVLSIDEAVGFHEQLMTPVRSVIGDVAVLHFAWVLPGAAFVALVGFACLSFLKALPTRTSLQFVAAGGLYVGGALGLEVLGGWLFATSGERDLRYICVATLEESCEMFGLILFLRAVLIHFEQTFGRLCLSVLPSPMQRLQVVTQHGSPDEKSRVLVGGRTE
ncbi:MAG: hypothetical protein VB858_09240 [Planctomycetaceae bacterium]